MDNRRGWGNKAYNEAPGQTFKPLKETAPNVIDPQEADITRKFESLPTEELSGIEEADPIEVSPLVQFDIQRAALNKIKGYQSIVVNVEDPETVKKATKAKTEVRALRLKVQRRQKEIDTDLVSKRKTLKTDALTITSEIKITEDYLKAELQKDIDHKAKLAEAARIEEAARVKKINENMRILTNHCEHGLRSGLDAAEITERLETLEGLMIPKEVFQEKYQVACDLLGHAISTAKENLDARQKWEAEEVKRQEELAALEKQKEINGQVAWFNKAFGWGADLLDMEDSLELLENSTFADHLSEMIEGQKIQAQDILVAARAANAEKERIRIETEAFEKAEKEKAAALKTETPEPEPEPEEKEETIKEVLPKKVSTWATSKDISSEPEEETRHLEPLRQEQIEGAKTRLNNIKKIATKSYKGEMVLSLSNKTHSLKIMESTDGLIHALKFIEDKLETRIEQLKNEM